MSTSTRPWTEEEVARAVALRRGGMSTLGISFHLGRMRREVEAKLWNAMEDSEHGPATDWPAELATGDTNEQIAARTVRTVSTVRTKRHYAQPDRSDARPQPQTGGA